MFPIATIEPILAAALAFAAGAGLSLVQSRRRLAEARRFGDRGVAECAAQAETQARRGRLEEELERSRLRSQVEAEIEQGRWRMAQIAEDLGERERAIDEGASRLESSGKDVSTRREAIAGLEASNSMSEARLVELQATSRGRLLERSGLSELEARALVTRPLLDELEKESSLRKIRARERLEADLDRLAGQILLTAIGRCQVSHDSESLSSVVPIPDERVKSSFLANAGPIASVFQEELGVEVLCPEGSTALSVLSSDGAKRETARRALEELVGRGAKDPSGFPADPAGIRENIRASSEWMERKLVKLGKWAARQAPVGMLDPSLLPLLGRLRFRTSYGQNVLYHSIEVALLTGLLGAEIGLDFQLATRAGLLHDIGKAVDREREGGHPELGAEILRSAGERPEVVDAALGHHLDPATQGIFPVLVGAADAISASRAGARRETGDRYAHRLEILERMACEEAGVETAYCVQGGREMRIFVNPESTTDDAARAIATRILQKISDYQKEAPFPGQMKVTFIREKRVVEFAR